MNNNFTEKEAKELIKGKLSRYFGIAPSEARKEQLYKAVVMSVRDIMLEKRHNFHLETKAKKAKKVVGYEIDTRLKPVLEETLAEFNNVEIVFSDVMKQKISDVENKLGKEYIMVANLPYYITTPIIMRFIENAKNIKAMVIMVQEEVAMRLASKAGDSDYGAITVGINLRGSAQLVIRVPRHKFTPPPNVDSAVVKIVMDKDKFVGVDFDAVRDVVRCAFSSRRKMLINNLMNGYKLSRQSAEKVLFDAGIDLTVRGENLSESQYVALAKVLNKKDI